MEVSLFIRGIKADVGIQKDFVRNFKRTLSFSDLSNPTSITTDYTYSATLPGTSINKAIFGYIENGTDAGVFNPASRYEYILNVNGSLWLHGDVQLTKIGNRGGDVTFSCSFYSRVHEKIVSLGNKDLKDLTILKENDYYRHLLDREAMAGFWGATHAFSDTIRYVPTRAGMYNDFQSDKMMYPVWNTGSEPATLSGYKVAELGSDYDEYATREYRIEYQRPAISIDKIMRGVCGDNGITVDGDLMASPLVQNGWLMCPQFTTESTSETCYGTIPHTGVGLQTSATAPGFNVNGMTQTSASPSGVFNGTRINTDQNCHLVTFEFAVRITAHTAATAPGTGAYIYLTPSTAANQPGLRAELADGGLTISQNEPEFKMRNSLDFNSGGEPWKLDETRRFATYRFPIQGSYPGWEEEDWFPVRFTFSLTPGVHSNHSFMLIMSFSRLAYSYYMSPRYNLDGQTGPYVIDYLKFDFKPITDLTDGDLTRVRDKGFLCETLGYATEVSGWSPLYVDMNTIMSKGMSQRDFLIDLTKMTGCIWDLEGGGIDIKTRNNFFSGYTVKDWTKKLDRSSEIEYTPLAYDKAVYTLSYTAGDSLLENQYKDKTGLDWGKQYIETGYQFNSDEEKLYTSPMYDTVMSKGERKAVYLNSSYQGMIMKQDPYEIPMIETKDHGSPKEGYRYLMDCGWQPLVKGQFVFISQDSSYMDSNDIGGRCWYDTEHYANAPAIANNIVICSAIPLFSTRRGYASFDFAKSTVSFSGETDQSYDASTALYPRFWGNYIGELYNARNQVMTAWFNLTPMDLLTFSFKDFVMVDNRLWHPNKVMDFDISGETLTKVELIEVHDIAAWTQGQNWDFETPVNSPAYNIPDSSSSSMNPYEPGTSI